MSKLSIAYGIIFIVMGLISYFGISSESITALIPVFFGIPMLILGWVGSNEKYLKHAMHGAAVLVLLGFFGTIGGLIKFIKMIAGIQPERHAAVIVQAIMALMCLIFLIFAVKSFIDARKSRNE